MKAGINYNNIWTDIYFPGTQDGAFVFTTDKPFDASDPTTYPARYDIVLGDPLMKVPDQLLDLFIQDSWRVSSNLTVNAGLRWDWQGQHVVRKDLNNFGPRLGVEQSRARYNVHEARGLPELSAFTGSLRDGATRPWRVLRGLSDKVGAMLPEQERDKQLGQALSEMRLLKDPVEIRELRTKVELPEAALQVARDLLVKQGTVVVEGAPGEPAPRLAQPCGFGRGHAAAAGAARALRHGRPAAPDRGGGGREARRAGLRRESSGRADSSARRRSP